MSNERSIVVIKNNNNVEASDLPAAAAALSPEDRAGLLNALKDKLQKLAGKRVDILQTLTSKVRKRIEVLEEIQGEHDELEAKFIEEKAALEAKYQKLYEPLYIKRYEIVNGIVEVEQERAEIVTSEEKDNAMEEKGVPAFWLTAMRTNEILANEIMEGDEGALKYLKDIRCCKIDDPKGFKLEFSFDPNPYFKNSVVTKTYHVIDDDGPVLEKAIGTDIVWYPRKCLTQRLVKTKPRKGSKNAKPKTKTEICESFFNFFKPPEIPEIDDEDDDADIAEELQNLMDQDYDIAMTIRDKLIPRAVSWFTGEAIEDDEYDVEEEDDDVADETEADKEEEDDNGEAEGKGAKKN